MADQDRLDQLAFRREVPEDGTDPDASALGDLMGRTSSPLFDEHLLRGGDDALAIALRVLAHRPSRRGRGTADVPELGNRLYPERRVRYAKRTRRSATRR